MAPSEAHPYLLEKTLLLKGGKSIFEVVACPGSLPDFLEKVTHFAEDGRNFSWFLRAGWMSVKYFGITIKLN